MLVPTERLSRMDTASVHPGQGASVVTVPADLSVVADVEAHHGQALFGFARRLGLNDAEAEDCVQETLLRLSIQLARGTRIDDLKGWVFRAGYRIAMDEHRLRRRLRLLLGRLPAPHSVDPATVSDHEALWAEVDRLTVRQRQVIYLRYRADLAFEQIAAVLGITSSAARSHATQALQALRAHIDPTAIR